ncbi:uncharacterized protein LOC134055504 [Cinclus cinclus]|uniref:uncharacterized protein LOC134055504 n=1 Tax=Cinclus cinclus TaxID=127875 RepID=UPI002E0E6146
MRLELLLLVAAGFPSCLSQTGHDSRQDSRQDSQGSSTQDSRASRRGSGHSRRHPTVTPRLLPPPLLLQLPPEPGPPRIRCLAPQRFLGSTFDLFQGIPGVPVRSIPAAPDRHWAEFSLPGDARCFWCRYRSHNGSAWLESELSSGIGSSDLGDAECQPGDAIATGPPPTAGTLRNDPSWLLPVAVGAAVLGLLLLLGAAAVAWRGLRWQRGQSHMVPAPSLPMAPAPSLSH